MKKFKIKGIDGLEEEIDIDENYYVLAILLKELSFEINKLRIKLNG